MRTCVWFARIAAAMVVHAAVGADVTFRVQVPAYTPPADTVYIAGDFQGWNPGHPAYALARQPDGRWQITLTLPENAPIQFKFTRGSWATVEKGPNDEEIPNRAHTPAGTQTLNLTVANWADGQHTIVGHVESFQVAPFLGGRRCWVYLPPGYATGTARYPVLYMHDGQNLFDVATSFAGEWRVDETCESLIGAGEIEPIIVVGIENSAARCTEYTPFPDATPNTACGVGGGANAYLSAIRDTLIPEVDRRYRTRPGPARSYMAGSSLGGLVSAYAGYAYADTWTRVAAVSPSYWWNDDAMIAFAASAGRPAMLNRIYQDMGTRENGATVDRDGNGVDDFIDDLRAMRDVAIAQGFVEGADFLSVEGAGHTHNEAYWALRLPNLLRFLIDPPRDCPGDTNDDARVDLTDLATLLAHFGSAAGCTISEGDIDGDGDVDLSDLATLLAHFGAEC